MKPVKHAIALMNSTVLARPLFLMSAASALLGGNPAQALDSNALPQGGNAVGGSATITQSGSTLNVNQSSNRAIIDWRSFDIGSNAQANFRQPSSSAIAVNRVNGSANPSQIEGALTANGQVWILNPNGVFFGKTARVDAAGILATTANINDKAFMAGGNTLQMTGGDSGEVANDGSITVGQSGMAAFVAPSVRNSGTIKARLGKVALAAGDTYTLDLAGDHLVEIGLGATKAVVDQSGKIVNPGGIITISAKAASQAVDSVINMSGVTSASSVKAAGGDVILGADDITTAASSQIKADGGASGNGGTITAVANKTGNYAGSFSAQGGANGGDGGAIETSGQTVHVAGNISVNTSAPKGKTGSWTLDPDDLAVGGSGTGTISGGANSDGDETIAASTVETALGTSNVNLQARKSITVNASINTAGNTDAHVLTLVDEDGGGLTVNLNAPISLGVSESLAGQATAVHVGGGGLIQNGIDVALAGATVNVAAGTYDQTLVVGKPLTLSGAGVGQSIIAVAAGATGLTIGASNVTVEGLTFNGPLSRPYASYAWGTASDPGNSWGIQVTSATTTGLNITNSSFLNLRTGILLANSGDPATGAASGAITNNLFDNTKGGMIDQYRDGSTLTLAGNSQGPTGNEWGFVFNTNLNVSNTGNTGSPSIIANSPTVTRQAALLAVSNANNGLSALDRGYTNQNRTAVVVDAAATGTPDNGFGNPRQPLGTLQAGFNAVVTGGTVYVDNGTYAVNAANGYTYGYLDITRSVNLVGQSEAGVIINAGADGQAYSLRIQANDVSLSNFTLNGSTTGYGIKVEPLGTGPINPNSRIDNFAISNVTIAGSRKNGLDLNGVVGATIHGLTSRNAAAGTGIAITDSANVAITDTTTSNNAWGGLALYQTNNYYNQQVTGIVVDGSNSFNEADGIYAQNQSALGLQFGTVNLAGLGINYIAQIATGGPDGTYSFFQQTQQGAIDLAAAFNTRYSSSAATVQGYAGASQSVGGDNVFTVGFSSSNAPLSINAAINAAASGATINVLSGTYAEAVNVAGIKLSLGFNNAKVNSLALASTAAGSSLSGALSATGAITLAGAVKLAGTLSAGSIAANGAVTLTGNTRLNATGSVTLASVDGATAGGQSLTIAAGSASLGSLGAGTVLGAVTDSGPVTLAGATYDAASLNLGAVTLTGNTTLNASGSVVLASVDGATAGGQSLAIAAGSASLGNLGASTGLGAVTDSGPVTLAGATYDAASLNLGAVTLTGNTTLNTSGAIALASVDGATAGGQSLTVTAGSASLGNLGAGTALGAVTDSGPVTLAGATYDAAGLNLGAVTLTGNTTLNATGSVALASVDGATAGGQSLTITAGSASLGNLGVHTVLGAVTDSGATTLTGSSYNAGSFDFAGAVTLTAATTTINTAQSATPAGNITFGGNIFGTADGNQSLVLAAGPGTGAASANGDIVMQDAGTPSVRLGSLTVSGNDFTALTVDIAGNFTSHLTGNQVFAADTLNAGGNVNSNVSGNAAGHIVASGGVAMNVSGGLSGNISGSTLALTTGSISNATLVASQSATLTTGNVSGTSITAPTLVASAASFNATVNAQNSANIQAATISGSYSGGAISLNATQNIGASVSANTLSLSAPQGSVTGNWTQSTVVGSLAVNGQSHVGNLNLQQLMVEGFALPAGTQIAANGALVLPAGMVIGLLSPGGGQPRLVMVYDVHSLGVLLADGYAAIVIDLSGRRKDGLMQVASN